MFGYRKLGYRLCWIWGLLPLCLAGGTAMVLTTASHAEESPTSVYAKGEKPNDERLAPLKDLNGDFSMTVPGSLKGWEKRAEDVRRRILVSCGLWPMPPRPEVKPTIHGRVDRDEYSVERVYFESYPGFFVTGSLYRPKGKTGPFPVVLSPHGHFTNGRFHDHGEEELIRQIKAGAERFEVGGRHPLQARCVHLARMGCIVFHYDMVGYADCKQISYELAHRHSSPRPEMENPKRWGLFTAQAEMRLQNVFGLQTFNSLRAVDFIAALPDADTDRIAVTGASGGGTQTMILAALEPRVAVSFPAVMVSTAMQGGCTCENASCLRVGTGNIEFAGLFAPRPQGISYANDWTKELRTKGGPSLEELYHMYKADGNLRFRWGSKGELDLTYFPHNFNHVSRDKMYDWMNEHLGLQVPTNYLEKDYVPLTVDELTVWDEDHPSPPSGDDFETAFLKQLSSQSDKRLHELAKDGSAFRKVVRPALKTILATSYDEVGPVDRENLAKADAGGYWSFKDKISTRDTELPVVFLHPKDWNNEVVIWASGGGKADLWQDGELRAEPASLLEHGYSIISVDLFQQGEFLDDSSDQPEQEQTRKVANNRDFAGFTFGYNPTVVGHRVHDLLTLLKFVDSSDRGGAEKVHLVGTKGAGPYVVLASVLAGKHIDKLAIDDGDFRFAAVPSWRHPDFLPGAVKYGDLPAMLGLSRAQQIWSGTKDETKAKAAMKPFANLDGQPRFSEDQNVIQAIVDWIAN